MQALRALGSGEFTIEEIDAITGPAIGRPKSATFRTVDIAGIDVLAHVARNLAERLDSDDGAATFALPPSSRRWSSAADRREGRAGFYKKRAGDEILTLDPATLTYRAAAAAKLPSLDAARSIEDVGERIRTLFSGKDKVGRFLRATLGPTLRLRGARSRRRSRTRSTTSTARCAGASAGSSGRSRRGTRSASSASSTRALAAPSSAARRRGTGEGRLHVRNRRRSTRVRAGRAGSADPARPPANAAASCAANAGASLVDLGDGVLASSSTRR